MTSFAILRLFATRFVVLNVSPSVAPGFYRATGDAPKVGSLVEFRVSEGALGVNSHLRNQFILKQVVASEGDHVDTTGGWLWINDCCIAPIYKTDSDGNPLPIWRAKRMLDEDEFFVFSARVPNSFDSRYFGPVRRSEILAVRAPLFTWNECLPPGSGNLEPATDPNH